MARRVSIARPPDFVAAEQSGDFDGVDDAHDVADEPITPEQFERIPELIEQQREIDAIDDPVERKAAAKRWAAALEGAG